MGKLQKQDKITVINNFTLQENKQFVANTTVRINGLQEVSIVRKGDSIESAEDAVMARAEEILFGSEFGSLQENKNFSLHTKFATVILEQGKKDPVSGTQIPDKKAEQVTVDLVVRDSEGNVTKQAVVTRLSNDLVEAESKAIEKALLLIGIGV